MDNPPVAPLQSCRGLLIISLIIITQARVTSGGMQLMSQCNNEHVEQQCLRHPMLRDLLQFTLNPMETTTNISYICSNLPDLEDIHQCLEQFQELNSCWIVAEGQQSVTSGISPDMVVFMTTITRLACQPSCMDINQVLWEVSSCLRNSDLVPETGTPWSPPKPECGALRVTRDCLEAVAVPACHFLHTLLQSMMSSLWRYFSSCQVSLTVHWLPRDIPWTWSTASAMTEAHAGAVTHTETTWMLQALWIILVLIT